MISPLTTPTLTAATAVRTGCSDNTPLFMSSEQARCRATYAPVMDAVRVPPSACNTSQSSVIVRGPSTSMSTTARNERPIKRWISCVRPLTRPSRSRELRVWVERGNILYFAHRYTIMWYYTLGSLIVHHYVLMCLFLFQKR